MRHWMRFVLMRYKIFDFFSSLLELPLLQTAKPAQLER
jgi:hypothetical protein